MDAARLGNRDYYPKMLNGVCRNAIEWGAISGGSDCAFLLRKGKKLANAVWNCATAKPAGVLAEILLNWQFGEIRLFPAMPLKGHYAFHSLRARGGFLVSSEFRDGKVPYVIIKSLAGNSCTVIQSFEQGENVVVRDLAAGTIVAEATAARADQPVNYKTIPGQVYVVERENIPLEKVPLIQR
jgi:alpha-L-fucosidase 2